MNEIEVLQQRVSELDQLKCENAELRAKLKRAAHRKQGPPVPANDEIPNPVLANDAFHGGECQSKIQDVIFENERLTKTLEEERDAYKRAFVANTRLKEKSQYYKDQARNWQKYHDRAVLASEKKLNNDLEGTAVNHTKTAKETKTPLISFSSALSDVPSNVNDGANTTRPTTAGSLSDPSVSHDILSAGNDNFVPFVDKAQNQPIQIMDNGNPTELLDTNLHLVENSSETSDELSAEGVLPPLLQHETHTPSGISAKIADHHKSDSPVVVLERSLKRKRQKDLAHSDINLYEDTNLHAGSAFKPIQVKSEPKSSSSIVHGDLSGPGFNVDSMDLDAVGDQILTPTKRSRLEHLMTLTQSERRLRPLNFTSLDGTTVSGDSHTGTEDKDKDQDGPASLNPALYTKMNQLIGLKYRGERRQRRDGRVQAPPVSNAIMLHTPQQYRKSTEAIQIRQTERILERQIRSENRELHSTKNIDNNNFPRSQSEPVDFIPDQHLPKRLPKTAAAIRNTALQPKTPNMNLSPRTYDKSLALQKGKLSGRKIRGEPPISIVAEDGEEHRSFHSAKSSHSVWTTAEVAKNPNKIKTPISPTAHLRLTNLLEGPSSDKPLLVSPAVIDKSTRTSRNIFRTPAVWDADKCKDTTSKQRKLDFPDATTTFPLRSDECRSIQPRHENAIEKDSNVVSPDDEPLRSRPLHRLCLEDFKINPNANQGMKYAFHEVIRKQDQRKCLPNCTKPECCGNKFRDLIKIGGFITPHRPGLWDSSPLDDFEEEQRLIQDFLGISRRELDSKSETERQRALEDARASFFANQHGKHKANGHQASPPGFWNVDIPTTQEELENRQEADRNEREKVEERYREAKRPNGRWKFRDE